METGTQQTTKIFRTYNPVNSLSVWHTVTLCEIFLVCACPELLWCSGVCLYIKDSGVLVLEGFLGW